MIFPFISSTIINIVNIHLLQSCGAMNANHIRMVLIFYLHCAPLFIALFCLCVLLQSVHQYVGHICMLFIFCETQQLTTCSFNVTIICETWKLQHSLAMAIVFCETREIALSLYFEVLRLVKNCLQHRHFNVHMLCETWKLQHGISKYQKYQKICTSYLSKLELTCIDKHGETMCQLQQLLLLF
jgi:hypothetical protein